MYIKCEKEYCKDGKLKITYRDKDGKIRLEDEIEWGEDPDGVGHITEDINILKLEEFHKLLRAPETQLIPQEKILNDFLDELLDPLEEISDKKESNKILNKILNKRLLKRVQERADDAKEGMKTSIVNVLGEIRIK